MIILHPSKNLYHPIAWINEWKSIQEHNDNPILGMQMWMERIEFENMVNMCVLGDKP